jgi:hypothetical protein
MATSTVAPPGGDSGAGVILREGRHRCPAHPDRRPSLDVRLSPTGRWLLICRAGCRTDAVLRAAGLAWRDLFPPGDRPVRPPRPWSASWRMAITAPILAAAQAQQAKLEPWLPVYHITDFIRTERQRIAQARALASAAGDCESVWHVLAVIAARECFVNAIEAEFDEALRTL